MESAISRNFDGAVYFDLFEVFIDRKSLQRVITQRPHPDDDGNFVINRHHRVAPMDYDTSSQPILFKFFVPTAKINDITSIFEENIRLVDLIKRQVRETEVTETYVELPKDCYCRHTHELFSIYKTPPGFGVKPVMMQLGKNIFKNENKIVKIFTDVDYESELPPQNPTSSAPLKVPESRKRKGVPRHAGKYFIVSLIYFNIMFFLIIIFFSFILPIYYI